MSHFAKVARVPGDLILGLLDAYRNDPRADKLDLGVGVCKDAQGLTPILRSVKLAEQRLVEQETTKSYVGGHGDALFAARLAELALGAASPLLLEQRADATQTPGGTGALRLAGDFIAHCLPGRGIWLSDPTWPIHETLFAAAGLKVSTTPTSAPTTAWMSRRCLLAWSAFPRETWCCCMPAATTRPVST